MTIPELEKRIDALPFEIDDGALIRRPLGVYYVSDAPPEPGIWSILREQHSRSGLWPVFLQDLADAPGYPWLDVTVGSRPMDRHWDYCDAETALRKRWNHVTGEKGRVTSAGRPWPGLAPGIESPADPGATADDFAERLINDVDTRLGLVLIDRGADLPMVTSWWAGDEVSPGEATAILRSWEGRFGARLIRVGFDSLVLSVAAPPTTIAAARHVAAEHLAFCPENVEDVNGAFAAYAEKLVGVQHWSFWWDREVPDGVFDEERSPLEPEEALL